ncbi:hypothetical protein AMTRI_Chr06g175530 [Amborella trichopoda]
MKLIIVFVALSMITSLGLASDPSPLQDFRVADDYSKGTLLIKYYNTSNPLGSVVTPDNVMQMLRLNTLGTDFVPGGKNPPHTHPLGTEILTV